MKRGETGDTDRWLVGVMGAVGGLMVMVVVGFQAQIDARQDEAIREVAKVVERGNTSAEKVADKLGEVTVELARIQARGDENQRADNQREADRK